MKNFKNYFEEKLPFLEAEITQLLPREAEKSWYRSYVERNNIINNIVWDGSFSRPFYHLFASGGKRLRPSLVCLIHDCLGGNHHELYRLAMVVELLHTGTLMVDDIEDNSELRRGKPTVHKKFNEAIAVNCGNFLYYLAYQILLKSKLNSKEKDLVTEIINTEMLKLHLGQGMDIYWSTNQQYQIDLPDYLLMCEYKTASLINISLRLGVILAGAENDNINNTIPIISRDIGIAFQIRDDILNLKPSEGWGKESGEDITEGKLTYLTADTLIRANSRDKSRLIIILKSRTKNKRKIEEAISILEKYGSFDRAQKYANDLIADAKEQIERNFPDNEYRLIIMEFLDFIVKRNK